MKRKEALYDIWILLLLLLCGLLVIALFNNVYTQLLFVVVMILALVVMVLRHRKGDNEYCCMKCGTKYKIGFLADLQSPELENGDRIFKCKKCKKKVNFRKL